MYPYKFSIKSDVFQSSPRSHQLFGLLPIASKFVAKNLERSPSLVTLEDVNISAALIRMAVRCRACFFKSLKADQVKVDTLARHSHKQQLILGIVLSKKKFNFKDLFK